MMLSIMCALWISSACAALDERIAAKAIGMCKVEMMKAAIREPDEYIFMIWCMRSQGLYYRGEGTSCPPDNRRFLTSTECWRRLP